MDSPFENPVIHYGMGLSSAVLLVIVAFAFLDGMTRWIMVGLAVVEVVVTPQILKRVANQ